MTRVVHAIQRFIFTIYCDLDGKSCHQGHYQHASDNHLPKKDYWVRVPGYMGHVPVIATVVKMGHSEKPIKLLIHALAPWCSRVKVFKQGT